MKKGMPEQTERFSYLLEFRDSLRAKYGSLLGNMVFQLLEDIEKAYDEDPETVSKKVKESKEMFAEVWPYKFVWVGRTDEDKLYSGCRASEMLEFWGMKFFSPAAMTAVRDIFLAEGRLEDQKSKYMRGVHENWIETETEFVYDGRSYTLDADFPADVWMDGIEEDEDTFLKLIDINRVIRWSLRRAEI